LSSRAPLLRGRGDPDANGIASPAIQNGGIAMTLILNYCIKSMKKILILIAILLFLPKIYAADAVNPLKLSVSPALLPVSLTPGKTIDFTLTVQNQSDYSVPVRLTVESFESTDEEGGYKFNAINSPLAGWVNIEKPDLIIDAGAKRQVNIAVKVPREVAVGGYYAVIFITPYSPANQDKPQVTPRIGVPIFASLGVDDKENLGTITTFQAEPMLSENGPVKYILRTKNSGLIHYSAKPKLVIKPVYGNFTYPEMELPEKIVLPGKIRRWEGTLPSDLKPNIYSLQSQISIGSGRWITASTIVIIFPWQKTLIVLFIGLLFVYLLLNMKNVSKAVKTLLKG
jgi:hypothetical protein